MTDSKTATERLREMLDARGVEHYDGVEITLWLKDEHGYRASADELTSGRMSVHIWCDTPEQAIAATLGEWYTREDVEGAFVSGYSLGTLPVGSDPQWDENRQTVDEHMAELGWVRAATLGAGECEMNRVKMFPEHEDCRFECWECSACKRQNEEQHPRFCPNCGRKVKR